MSKRLFFLFYLISFGFAYLFTYRLKAGEFLFMGDQFFRFSLDETITNLFIRKDVNLGIHNSWQLITQLWDIIFYYFVYGFGFSKFFASRLLFFVVNFLLLSLSFIGFRKLKEVYRLDLNIPVLTAITLFYAINPFTLILWHGGILNLGSVLSYSLAPLIVYYFHRVFFENSGLRDKVLLTLLLFFSSFTFWLFAVLALFLVLYLVGYAIIARRPIISIVKNGIVVLLLYLPLVSVVIFALLNEYFNNSKDNNFTFGPTYLNEQGGLLYQFLMYFSWGIYTLWFPRAIYPFADYYFSYQYILATVILYAFLLFGLAKQLFAEFSSKSKEQVGPPLLFVAFLAISLFLGKGSQPPLGEIFTFLYEKVPLFYVFRSADHRFGFSTILFISILLLFLSKYLPKKLFVISLLLIILIQSFPLFNGSAIYGENVMGAYQDRVLYYPETYQEVTQYLNNDQTPDYMFVLSYPGVDYGHFKLDNNDEYHIGQDILSKEIRSPFVYLSDGNGTHVETQKKLTTILSEGSYQRLKEFSISHLLLRRDVVCISCQVLDEEALGSIFPVVFENEMFTLYLVDGPPPVSSSSNYAFQKISPVEYTVQILNLKDPTNLDLLLSYSKNWHLLMGGESLNYSHSELDSYANTWRVDPNYIQANIKPSSYTANGDGSLDLTLRLLYKPQTAFNTTLFISVASLVIAILYLLLEPWAKKRGGLLKAKSKEV